MQIIYDPYPGGTFLLKGYQDILWTQDFRHICAQRGYNEGGFCTHITRDDITGSKLARILCGGVYGHSGTDMSPDEESHVYAEKWRLFNEKGSKLEEIRDTS